MTTWLQLLEFHRRWQERNCNHSQQAEMRIHSSLNCKRKISWVEPKLTWIPLIRSPILILKLRRYWKHSRDYYQVQYFSHRFIHQGMPWLIITHLIVLRNQTIVSTSRSTLHRICSTFLNYHLLISTLSM
jgi:hypothetical protein